MRTTIKYRNNDKFFGERNMKKKNIKSNGYDDKLFIIEQNLPSLSNEWQIEIDYDDISILSYDSRYYYDNHNYEYDEYDDYYDNWSYN